RAPRQRKPASRGCPPAGPASSLTATRVIPTRLAGRVQKGVRRLVREKIDQCRTLPGTDAPELIAADAVGLDRVVCLEKAAEDIPAIAPLYPLLQALRAYRCERHRDAHSVVGRSHHLSSPRQIIADRRGSAELGALLRAQGPELIAHHAVRLSGITRAQ